MNRKYNDRERNLLKNARKLIDMLTHPTLQRLLTDKEYRMVGKIREEIKNLTNG